MQRRPSRRDRNHLTAANPKTVRRKALKGATAPCVRVVVVLAKSPLPAATLFVAVDGHNMSVREEHHGHEPCIVQQLATAHPLRVEAHHDLIGSLQLLQNEWPIRESNVTTYTLGGGVACTPRHAKLSLSKKVSCQGLATEQVACSGEAALCPHHFPVALTCKCLRSSHCIAG